MSRAATSALAAAAASAVWAADVGGQPITPITNGAAAPDDTSVVALVYDGVVRCTGTLVSPHVVLTAAHCVHSAVPASALFVDGAASAASIIADVPVVWTLRHPAFDADQLAHDIGAVVLAGVAPAGVSPVSLAPAPVAEGAPLRLVGFGRTSALAMDEGARRQGIAVVDSVDALSFRYRPSPSQACIGDSGGPAFAEMEGGERLAGVTSHGDPLCAAYGQETRVDAYAADFIQPLVEAAAGRQVDVGSRCLRDESCASGACVAPLGDGHRYCSIACASDSVCPEAAGRCEAGACRPQAEPGGAGARCRAGLDCASGVCGAEPGEPGWCTERCDPAGPSCPGGATCGAGQLIGSSSTAPEVNLCAVEPGAGCSAGGAGRSPAGWLGLAALLVAISLRLLRGRLSLRDR